MDVAWRLATDPTFEPLQQLVPALSGAGTASGSGSSAADAKAAQARAIALLRSSATASGDDAAAAAAGAAAGAAQAQPAPQRGQATPSQRPASQLRPFVGLAYGASHAAAAGKLTCAVLC